MSLKLNAITDDGILKDIEQSKYYIEQGYPSFDADKKKVKLKYYINHHYELGCCFYQQEHPSEEIIHYFSTTVNLLLTQYESREKEDTGSINLWDYFIKNLPLSFCFGTADEKLKMASLEDWRYFNSTGKSLFPLLALIEVIKKYILDHNTNVKTLEEIVNTIPNGSRSIKPDLIPFSDALKGIISKDETLYNQGLEDYLIRYKNLAKKGSYKHLHEGLLCLPALMLYKMACNAGLNTEVSSIYMPRQLLN